VKERNLTCIVCPRGCALTVHFDEAGKITTVEGNACKRGAVYAEKECTHPERTVTSTVRTEGGAVVAVKTATTVPKEKVFEVMEEINAARAPKSVSIGDVIIENVAGTGVAVVATSDI
jgi:CxxC motif-containing protein